MVEKFYNATNNDTLPKYGELNPINQSNTNKMSIDQFLSMYSDLAPQVLGTRHITGLLTLIFISTILYKTESSSSQAAAVLTPTVFILGNYGFLPFGSGLIYGTVLAAAALLALGLTRYL